MMETPALVEPSMSASPRFPRVVDDVNVRLVAAAVLVLAIAALGLHQWWIYAVLAVDFTLRVTFGPKASPLAQAVQRFVRPRVRAARRPTAGPPKRFAAGIGAVLTTAAAALWALGHGRLSGTGVDLWHLRGVQGVCGPDEARSRARGDLSGVRRHQPAQRRQSWRARPD